MTCLSPRRGFVPLIRIYAVVALLVVGAFTGVLPTASARADASPVIVVGSSAPQLEQYAARELQRYLLGQTGTLPRIISDTTPSDAPAFVVGRPGTNTLLRKMVDAGNLTVSGTDPGPQGYVLKKAKVAGRDLLAVAGSDENGVLYGVYGLLTDYYGVSFSFTGDVYPRLGPRLGWLTSMNVRLLGNRSVGSCPGPTFPSRPRRIRVRTTPSSSTRWRRCG